MDDQRSEKLKEGDKGQEKVEDTTHDIVHQQRQAGAEEEPVDSDSSEDREFWKGAALVLSQIESADNALDQEGGNNFTRNKECDTSLCFLSEECAGNICAVHSSDRDQSPDVHKACCYNSDQIELKRLKAIQLLSQKKGKSGNNS